MEEMRSPMDEDTAERSEGLKVFGRMIGRNLTPTLNNGFKEACKLKHSELKNR